MLLGEMGWWRDRSVLVVQVICLTPYLHKTLPSLCYASFYATALFCITHRIGTSALGGCCRALALCLAGDLHN